MGYQNSPFGDDVLTGSGGNVTTKVHNHYGPRNTGGTTGVNKVEGITEELTIVVTGEMFNDVDNTLVPYELPAGALPTAAYMQVEEAFVATGTSPTLLVGTDGSEATNGISATEAQIEATGSYDLTSTLAGTWAAVLASDTTVGIALGGTTPAITDAGKARITIVYDRVNLGL